MKKIQLVFLFFSIFTYTNIQAQQVIKGKITDSVNNINLADVSVILINAKDSIIIADNRSSKTGEFVFENIPHTDLIVYFSYPKYLDYFIRLKDLNISSATIDLKEIHLLPKAALLEQVIVRSGNGQIRIKGDTTEFKADSFVVHKNATVEDLLKQLPGLQIDPNGNITAHGQTVRTVLVEGEEFFGDDPTLVTRNIRADMVETVQVFDKKSDQATFTGIDDGVRNKTINLKLKEDKNNGIFGKAEAGAGAENFYAAQGFINHFKPKHKKAAFITSSNTGKSGLENADKQRLGVQESGNGSYNGAGIPQITSGGAHLDQKWDKNKNSLNSNYQLRLFNNRNESVVNSVNNLPSNTIYGKSESSSRVDENTQYLNAQFIRTINSKTTLKIFSSGSVYKNNNAAFLTGERNIDNEYTLNNYSRNQSGDINTKYYTLNINWEQRLKKTGRSYAVYLENGFTDATSNQNYFSRTDFYNLNNNIDSSAVLSLLKRSIEDKFTHGTSITYTEPLSRKVSLLVTYRFNYDQFIDDQQSFNNNGSHAGEIDYLFSNNFHTNQYRNRGKVDLNYVYRKLTVKIGGGAGNTNLHMENRFTDHLLKRNFTTWNPSSTITYRLSVGKTLNLIYNGNTIVPERDKIQPFRYNNSQTTFFRDNLNLNSSFDNSFQLEYTNYKVASETYLRMAGSAKILSNPASLSINITPNGIYEYRYINLPGENTSSYTADGFISKKIKSIKSQVTLMGSITGGESFNLVNDVLNKLNYHTVSGGVGFYKAKANSYDITVASNLSYTKNRSSLQTGQPNDYLGVTIVSRVNLFLGKYQLSNDVNYLWQQKNQFFDENFNRFLWNAWIGRKFLKNEQLMVKISCNDILNQNRVYNRTATDNFFEESSHLAIKRFFLIGATWNFSRFKRIHQ
ncbi:outer membrane beta-barrel protein [Gynurincola endophyticus]|uniref:outer membrane beta-barrel protein n=1 Tax=Gynurincola endophyticus TaxID=2479004 RepID=UPI000F8F0C25|nr:outer membrane beta-barrel protein [Gynurincola endophyticus]